MMTTFNEIRTETIALWSSNAKSASDQLAIYCIDNPGLITQVLQDDELRHILSGPFFEKMSCSLTLFMQQSSTYVPDQYQYISPSRTKTVIPELLKNLRCSTEDSEKCILVTAILRLCATIGCDDRNMINDSMCACWDQCEVMIRITPKLTELMRKVHDIKHISGRDAIREFLTGADTELKERVTLV